MTKMTKKLRKALILQRILDGTFDRQELTKEMGCSDRAFRRDLSQIADELGKPFNDQMKVLRAVCAEKLTVYAALDKLPASVMAKLLVAGETRKVELTEEITENKTVTYNVNAMLAEYEHLIKTDRTETTIIPNNNTTEPIYKTETNNQASTIPVN
jgi:hypothetical protein